MNLEKFSPKFGKWADKFRDFIESPEMDEIYKKLKEESRNGVNILPASGDTFKIFERVDPDNLKVIIYLMDPYPWVKNGENVATGVALECDEDWKSKKNIQPSLTKFYEGIENELYNGLNLDYFPTPCLSYLTDQGVMLINSDLTVRQDKPGSHKGLWKEFMKYFLEEIIAPYHPGVPIVFCGKNSQELVKFANPLRNYIFQIEHPSFAARENRDWKTEGVFKKINKILKDNNNQKIDWLLEIPF